MHLVFPISVNSCHPNANGGLPLGRHPARRRPLPTVRGKGRLVASFDGKPQSPCGRFAGWGSCCFSEQERCGGSGSVDVKRVAIRRPSRQLSAKPRRSDRAAASGVRKRDVLTGARSQGRSAVERVTEAVTGAGIMFRPFKSLGVVDFPGMRHHPIPCHAASSRCRSPPGRPLGYGGGGAGARGDGAWSARTRPSREAATVGATRRLPLGWRAERCRGSMPVTVGAVAARAACQPRSERRADRKTVRKWRKKWRYCTERG